MITRTSLSLLRLLCNLRWLAIAGQSLTVLIVTGPLQVTIPSGPLWTGIGALALFNLYAAWRVHEAAEISAGETFAHILVDIGVLAWLIGWSGGIENPFSSLFLLPIALSVLALPSRWVWATAIASAVGYLVSALLGPPLPHVHNELAAVFNLHKTGMLANFVISAIVVLVFFTRMLAARRQNEKEVAGIRDQFTRNEGILALATHAASVAHELNTPLGTMTLMVEDWLEAETGSKEPREDYLTMRAMLALCRDRVRELAAPADFQVDLERVVERWQLLRPTVELRRTGSCAGLGKIDPAVAHLLQALLNNAADASEQAGVARVDLDLRGDGRGLHGEIRDYGVGFDEAKPPLPATLFRTSKPEGMGLGLALSHATVERLGGELSMQAIEGRGVRVVFYLPQIAAS